MRVSMTVPNKSNPQNFNLVYNGCIDETRTKVKEFTLVLKNAVKMYNEKEIYKLTGMEFIDFVNFNESTFNLSIKEVEFLHINI